MDSLLLAGNLIFMGILSLLLLIILVISVYNGVQILQDDILNETRFRHRLTYIKSLGIFTFVLGIFFQFLGLYQFLSTVSQSTYPSPILNGGLKETMLSTLYGLIIFLISYIIGLMLDHQIGNRLAQIEKYRVGDVSNIQ